MKPFLVRTVRKGQRALRCLLAATLAPLAACDGGGSSLLTVAPPALGVVVMDAAPHAVAGARTVVRVNVAREGGFGGTVELAIEGAPSGLEATFAPARLPAGTTSSTLTLAPSATVPPGKYSMTVRARGEGVESAASLPFVVEPGAPLPGFALTPDDALVLVPAGGQRVVRMSVSRRGGFAAPVAMTYAGVPTGVTVTPTPFTGDAATLTFAVAGTATPGNHVVTVRATAAGAEDQLVALALTITAPGASGAFSLAADPAVLALAPGASSTGTLEILRTGGFTGAVLLTSDAVPPGIALELPAEPVTGVDAPFTLRVLGTVAPATYPVRLRGSAPGFEDRLITLSVIVPPSSAAPGFAVGVATSSLTVVRGTSSSATLTVARTGGYAGAVTLLASSQPSGLGAEAPAAPVSGGTANIAVRTNSGVPAGTYTVFVQATAPGMPEQTASFRVTVIDPPDFDLTLGSPGLVLKQGTTATVGVTLARRGGFAGAVAVGIAGLPSGVTAAPLAIGGNEGTLTLTAAPSATPGSFSLKLTGTGAGVASRTATLDLAVANAGASGGFTVSTSPVAVAPGATATTNVQLTRSAGFTGAIVVTTSGAPSGLTVTAPSGAVAGATAALSVQAASTLAPGSYDVTVRGSSSGLQDQTSTLTVTVSSSGTTPTTPSTGAFALGLAPSALTLAPGASGTATLAVTRSGGFSGAVTVSASGTPTGMTVGASPNPVTGGSATVSVTVGAEMAPGSYTIALAATGGGVAPQSVPLTIQVSAPATATNAVTYTFCAPDLPLWFAYQSEQGAWTRVQASAGNTYRFSVGARGGVAWVTALGGRTELTVLYATAAELAPGGSAPCLLMPTGVKSLSGSMAGLGASEIGFASLGTALGQTQGPGGFTFDSVPAGALNLVASRNAFDAAAGTVLAANRLILRRSVNAAAGSALPALDFASAEAFAPTTATLTVSNLGADSAVTGMGLTSGNIGSVSYAFTAGLATQRIAGLPLDRLAAGELQSLVVYAEPLTSPNVSRTALTYFRSVGARTVALGPSLASPSISGATGGSYLRHRAVLPLQGEYARLVHAEFKQPDRAASISATSGYTGPTTAWDVSVPDLSAAGFDPGWALRSGQSTEWTVEASGGTFLPELGTAPVDGSVLRYATRTGTTSASLRALGAPTLRRSPGTAAPLARVLRARQAAVRRMAR